LGFIKGINEIKSKASSFSKKNEDEDWFDKELSSSQDSTEPDNWRWELEFSDVIESYVHTLRKEKKNNKGQWQTLEGQIPYMNEDGICFSISSLQPILNKGTPLGYISKIEANTTTNVLVTAFKDKILRDHDTFEIEKTNIPMLVFGYYNMVRMILSRSINDGERKIRAKVYSFKDNYSHDEVNPDEISSMKL